MIEWINQYATEITMVSAILIPLMPSIILRTLSDKRLQSVFTDFRNKVTLDSLTAQKLYNRVESMGQIVSGLIENKELQDKIMNVLETYKVESKEMQSVFLMAMADIKVISQRLQEKDEIITYLSNELKEIKIQLGVRS